LAWRQTVSDCASTPLTASKTATAPSSTRRLRSTSAVKSTWPGVSMMLIEWLFHSAAVAADWIVIPRLRSSSRKSIVASPSWTSPVSWILPVRNRMRSVTVVLPASMWAMMPMLRCISRPRFTFLKLRGESDLVRLAMAVMWAGSFGARI
jgi:hypothetical protein